MNDRKPPSQFLERNRYNSIKVSQSTTMLLLYTHKSFLSISKS